MATYSTLVDCGILGDQSIDLHYTVTPPKRTLSMALGGEPGDPPDPWEVTFESAMLGGLNILHHIPESALEDFSIEIIARESE